MASRPRNRAFYHPSLRDDRTSRLSRRFFDDIQAYRRVLSQPCISPFFTPHPRESRASGETIDDARLKRHSTPSSSEMSAGWTSKRSKNPFVSTQHCRLRPLTFFFPIVAAFSACFGRCDGLGVQNADGRLRVAIQRLSRQFAQRIIDGDKGSIAIPFVKIVSNRTHWRNIVRTHAPLAPGAMVGAQRVDDRAVIDVGRATAAGRRGGDRRRDSGPRFIGQIGRILGWRGSQRTSWHTRLLLIRTAWSPS